MLDRLFAHICVTAMCLGFMYLGVKVSRANRDNQFKKTAEIVASYEPVLPCYVKVKHYVDPKKVDPTIPECVMAKNDWRKY